jgi:hypothetical protein
MARFITEMLKEINDDPKTLEKWKDNAALKILFMHAFQKEHKFVLPEGDPPYTEAAEPMGMTPTNFTQEMRRMYVFCRDDLKPIKREALFISLLEGIHPTEAKILLAVKDQKLNKMYPKITAKLVAEAGMITLPVKEKKND